MTQEFSNEQKFHLLSETYRDDESRELIEAGIKHGATPAIVALALRLLFFEKLRKPDPL